MRIPQPFFRESEQAWYIQLGKKQRSLGKDKKKAFAKGNELVREWLRTSGIEPDGGCTLHELIDSYVDWLIENRAPTNYASQQYFFRDLKAAFPSSLSAEALKPVQVEEFLRANKKIKSPTTKRDRITRLIGVYNWGIRYGLLRSNPLRGMERPAARVRQDFVPAERFNELFNHVTTDSAHDFLLVMLDSGCRAQEMFKMTAKNFDGEKLTFIIEDSKGKKRSRVIFLPELSREIVARLAKENPRGPLFLNTEGRPWNKDSVNCMMRRLKVKFEMPTLCATTLRHSFAVWRLSQGQDPLFVAKLMGHKDTKMLATRYGHIDGSDILKAKANEIKTPVSTDRSETSDPKSNDAA